MATAAPGPEEFRALYRERAHLVGFLAGLLPSGIHLDGDPDSPGWAVVYVDTVTGQASWHISPDDLDLFGHVPRVDSSPWDGHTTTEKYDRLDQGAVLSAHLKTEVMAIAARGHGSLSIDNRLGIIPEPGPGETV